MESSNLTPEENRSLFEIFSPLDFREEENAKSFQTSLSAFREFIRETLRGAEEAHPAARDAIKEFDKKLMTLPQFLGDQGAIVERLKDIDAALPHFCGEMGLNDRQTSAVLEEFTLFLFNVSEIHWIPDGGKRKITRFQTVIRRCKEKITAANWEPETAKMIDDLLRYGRLPDIFELLSKVPLMHRWHDHFLIMKKRTLVARLLPRVAMMPLRPICWLQGNESKSVDRGSVESESGGFSIGYLSVRIAVKIPRLRHGLASRVAQAARSPRKCFPDIVSDRTFSVATLERPPGIQDSLAVFAHPDPVERFVPDSQHGLLWHSLKGEVMLRGEVRRD